MKTHSLLFLLAIAGIVSFASCDKDQKMVPVKILLTDNPATYDEVNVHIKGMQVKVQDETWITINAKDTVVNLLELQNGVTTLIAQDSIPEGILKEIRLILGSDNTVVINGTSHDLQTPSAEDSGLKIKINKALNESLNTFLLDFDASLSVKEENGNYRLSPVIWFKE